MEKPRNYDNTQSYGNYEPIPSGNYTLVILNVEETVSTTNKPMLKINLDVKEGEQRGRFTQEYNNDTRQNKKWPCQYFQPIYDRDGNCSRGFKTFINSVAISNPGFDPNSIWGDHFESNFKRMVIGGGFRREQYLNDKRELKWSTKCYTLFPVEEVSTRPKPEDKPLDPTPEYMNSTKSWSTGDYNKGNRLPWDD